MCDTEAEKKVESVEGDEKKIEEEIDCLVNRIRRKDGRKEMWEVIQRRA